MSSDPPYRLKSELVYVHCSFAIIPCSVNLYKGGTVMLSEMNGVNQTLYDYRHTCTSFSNTLTRLERRVELIGVDNLAVSAILSALNYQD